MYLNRDAQVSRKFGSFYTGSPGHSPITTSTEATQQAGLSLDFPLFIRIDTVCNAYVRVLSYNQE